MTTYTFANPLQMTEFFENGPFYLLTGNTWGSTLPFYVDTGADGKQKFNFGYGLNLTANASDSALVAQINSIFSSLGITLTSSQWNDIANGTNLTSLQNTLNNTITTTFSDTPSAVQSAANSLSSYYYSNEATPQLQTEINTYNSEVPPSQQISWSSLPTDVQAALLDLQYNTGGSFLGPKLLNALSNQDYASAAYELAFDTANSTGLNSGYEKRALADAAQMLGFNVTLDGNYQIVSLTPNSGMNTATVIKFLEDKEPLALAFGINSVSIQNFMNALTKANFLFAIVNAFNSFWGTTFSAPTVNGSPIILDLTGDGVTTVPQGAGTYFDLRNSGFAEKTGWAGPTDGLLAWDRNGNGTIDNGGELFGNYTQRANGTTAANGFDALLTYDANHDGKINAGDAIWNNLKIWIDANGNGVTDAGELRALASLNIQSLSLNDTDQGYAVTDAAGNHPEFVSTYTKTDNSTAAMTDVFFVNDTSQTVPLSWVAATPAIDALPDLPGMGTMYSLHQAMARDSAGALQTLVTQFVNGTTIAARNATMEQLLITWAGAQNVNPTSRNGNNGATRAA